MTSHPRAVDGRFAMLLLSVTLLVVAAMAMRYLLFEQSRVDPQHIHALLDKVLP